MGLFLQYAGRGDDFDGKTNEYYFGTRYFHTYDMESELDSFAMRLLYGLPMGGFKVGGEVALTYRREENETFNNEDLLLGNRLLRTNFPFGANTPWVNLFPFMFPYDSKYWEALFKGSLTGAVGPAKIAFTLRGGFIFAGDNNLNYSSVRVPSLVMDGTDMDGDVKGWKMGGEFWLRYPLSKGLSLPFVVKVDYQKKTRDGDGLGFSGLGLTGLSFDYRNRERLFQVEAGGGLDKELNKGTRIAAGIYYNYIKDRSDFVLHELFPVPGLFADYDHNTYPNQREHRVILRFAGEKELCPTVAMRMGLNFFYGWVKEDFSYDLATNSGGYIDVISLDGHRWGIGASLGATVKFPRFHLEPFINGGYQKLDVDEDGNRATISGISTLYEMDRLRKEWSIGGGFSIKF